MDTIIFAFNNIKAKIAAVNIINNRSRPRLCLHIYGKCHICIKLMIIHSFCDDNFIQKRVLCNQQTSAISVMYLITYEL